MATKTVYRKVVDIDVGAGVTIIPDNNTLMLEQLTEKAPNKPEAVEFSNLESVFEHYQPQTEITFENEKGVPFKETLKFESLNDFGPSGLSKNSEFLKDLQNKKEVYENFIDTVKKNPILRGALSDPDAKEQLIKGLQAMISELDESLK